jgi:hypothetical protein
MENNQKHPLSHEEREVQTLVERIEQMEVTREATREAGESSTTSGKQSSARFRERMNS